MENIFEELNKINVNEHTENKNGLTYLSWAWAIAEVLKKYPDMRYDIKKFADKDGVLRPYMYDENTGYMVETCVTIGDITRCMWLPVMDNNNHAMKSTRYEIATKYKTIVVEPATMFDVNKTIMRCLTKNLAMFGLGLYIYAGEDLPEEPQQTPAEKAKATREANKEKIAELNDKGTKTISWLKGLKREITPEEDIKVKELLRDLQSFTECREVAEELAGAFADNDKIMF